jgi:HAE1 family hydrophobic/amphiphilic exporter-1
VVNNGIILADSLHKGIGEKELSEVELERYIMDTALSRFRPVFITVATTVLGMLPLLLSSGDGAALWRPFALTVCAGLAGSTLLTLVLLPLVFYYYYRRDVGRPGSEAITRCIGPLNPPKGDFVQIEYF